MIPRRSQGQITHAYGRTRGDGSSDIDFAGAGIYYVSVTPREGYLSSDAQSKRVTVAANANAAVDLTLYRAGTSTPNPPVER